MNDVRFKIFGKDGCSLCKNRKDFIEGFLSKNKINAKIEYVDVSTPEGLTEFSVFDEVNEIPSVVLYINDKISSVWNGPKSVPATKEMMDIFGDKK